MGVDYYAKLVAGVVFDKSDFIESRVITTVLCDHTEANAPKIKFCPICGIKVSERTTSCTLEFPRSHLHQVDPFCDMSLDGEEDGWFDSLDVGTSIGDLTIFDVSNSSSPKLVLGLKILSSGSSRGGDWVAARSISSFEGALSVCKKSLCLLQLGDKEVNLYCMLEAS